MNNISKKIKFFVMYFSFKERKFRELKFYEETFKSLDNLTDLELSSEYVSTKSDIESKKWILSLLLISILLSILGNLWGNFYKFLDYLFKLFYKNQTTIQFTTALISIFIIIFITISFAIFIFLLAYIKNLKYLYKYLLIIEEVRSKKEK